MEFQVVKLGTAPKRPINRKNTKPTDLELISSKPKVNQKKCRVK